MRHIGILGGTFDPIHKGHLWIASQAKEEYGLTEIWLMPAGNPYFKEGDPVTPAPLRFQMTALAAGERPGFFASDYEIRKEGPIRQRPCRGFAGSIRRTGFILSSVRTPFYSSGTGITRRSSSVTG